MAAGQAPHTGPGAGECAGRGGGREGGEMEGGVYSHLTSPCGGKGVLLCLKWDQTMSRSRVACNRTVTRQV